MEVRVNIEVLQAREGDCIFITIADGEKDYIIMIDSGVASTYRGFDKRKRSMNGPLKNKIEELRAQHKVINLLVLTHVDEDHIGGVKEWLADDESAMEMIDTVWMNNGDKIDIPDHSSVLHSIAKGKCLEKMLLAAHKNLVSQVIKGKVFQIPYGKIVVLTPTVVAHNVIAEKWVEPVLHKIAADYTKPIKDFLDYEFCEEDSSKTNNSSISFILNVGDRNDLLLGDADITDVCLALKELGYNKEKPLVCKTVKLAHHGSRNNFSDELLELVNVEIFIFSSNGNYYGHPDKDVFARIIDKTSAKEYFNYEDRAQKIISAQDVVDYPLIKQRIVTQLND